MKTRILLLLGASMASLSANQANPGASAAGQPTAVPSTPSRFLATTTEDYLAQMKSRLTISSRERGPFGLFQAPGKAPVLPKDPLFKKQAKTPFSDIIGAIEISVVYPAEQKFMVKSQVFTLGQVFTIPTETGDITCRVESVRSTGVLFKNVKSGEVAKRELEFLPPGVRPGGTFGKVDGVTEVGRGRPAVLKIDKFSPPPTP